MLWETGNLVEQFQGIRERPLSQGLDRVQAMATDKLPRLYG
jgi:hypothetical protein